MDIAKRALKAALCRELAYEARRLDRDLTRAIRQGHTIDWEYFSSHPPTPTALSIVRINRDGSYLELALPQTRRLTRRDWSRLTGWLELRSEGIDGTAELTDTESLLGQD